MRAIPEAACDLALQARVGHVAVVSGGAPHVTPVAIVASGGALWFVASRSSVKVRALRRDPRVGVLLRDGERSVTVSGRATVLGPQAPADAARLLAHAPWAFAAAGRYAVHHAALVAGFATDMLTMAAPPPVDRVLVRIDPDAGALVSGDEVVESWGVLAGSLRGGGADAAAPMVHGLPRRPAACLRGQGPAVLGVLSGTGPMALPGDLAGSPTAVEVAPSVARLGRLAPGAAASLVVDSSAGSRPSDFTGVMLRGTLASVRRGDPVRVTLAAQRVTWWDGVRAGTVRSGVDEAAAAA